MKIFAAVVILLSLKELFVLCDESTMFETNSCPLTEMEWKQRNYELKCRDGEHYFCSLAEDNSFISGCLAPYPIPANSEGCPFVVAKTKLIPYREKFTPCHARLRGCPPKVHPVYSITELYKYPLCLMPPEKRNVDITELQTFRMIRHIPSGNKNDGGITTTDVIVMIVVAVVVIVIAVTALLIYFFQRMKDVFGRRLADGTLGYTGPSQRYDHSTCGSSIFSRCFCCNTDGDDDSSVDLTKQVEKNVIKGPSADVSCKYRFYLKSGSHE